MSEYNCTIEKSKDKDDFDNFCFQPTDGGRYSIKDAIKKLENSSGGNMQIFKGKDLVSNISVHYDKSQNAWIQEHLKTKGIKI